MAAVAKQFIVDTPTLYYGDIELSNPDTWAETLKGKELGLSKDGIKFSCKPTIRQIEYDGRMEKQVQGMDRITKWDISAEGEIVQFRPELLPMALIKKGETESTKFDLYTPSNSLADSDYKVLVIVGKVHNSDEPIILVVENTYNGEGFEFEGKDNEESTATFTMNAHYKQDSDDVPCKIYCKKAVLA